jgi:hypothetical protein
MKKGKSEEEGGKGGCKKRCRHPHMTSGRLQPAGKRLHIPHGHSTSTISDRWESFTLQVLIRAHGGGRGLTDDPDGRADGVGGDHGRRWAVASSLSTAGTDGDGAGSLALVAKPSSPRTTGR